MGWGNTGNFLYIFKTRVKDIYVQDWHFRLENSTRARCYINVAKFYFQKYLDLLKIEKYRKSLCKLRVSLHRLEVKTGRWAKPNKMPLDNRKCMICNILEDEFQFVLECSLYKDLRKNILKTVLLAKAEYAQINRTIFFRKRLYYKKNLSIFIDKAFKMREQSGII